jgi:4-amino-4-deoxy-L-arabinose transferase-like glycosyltransferase
MNDRIQPHHPGQTLPSRLAASRTAWALMAILIVAATARLWGLAQLPPGLFVDEAFTGYDAFSLLQTGQDLRGDRLPIYFVSWGGDAVEGLYRYLVLPFMALLGPVALAVRLPAALAGLATVALTFLLGRRLLGDGPALLAAGLLAVSPWHLVLSRVAFRAILLPAGATATVLLAVGAAGIGAAGIARRPRPSPQLWPAVAAVGALTLYTYAVAKLFVPCLLLLLVWVGWRNWGAHLRWAGASLALAAVIAAPAIHETARGRGQVRFQRISVFATPQIQSAAEDLRRRYPASSGIERVASSPTLTVVWTITVNYLSHFRPGFLVGEGDQNLRHSPPGVGQLLHVEMLLLAAGALVALRRRSPGDRILLGWVLLGPLADSLTADGVPNALRSIAALPAPQLLAAVGAAGLWTLASRPARGRWLRTAMAVSLAGWGAVESGRYLHRYFTGYAAASAPYWNAGYPEGVLALQREAPPDARLLVALPDRGDVIRYRLNPYVHSLILFYAQLPPRLFQERQEMGRFEVVQFAGGEALIGSRLAPGAWALVPAERADPDHVVRWIHDPGGRRVLAVIAAPSPS